MARNGSGTYSLAAGNPVVTATTISISWANDTLSDIETAMTDSLSRGGSGGMLAALHLVDGTVSAPTVAWTSETNSGFYRAGAADVRLALLGTDVFRWNTTQAVVHGPPVTHAQFSMLREEIVTTSDRLGKLYFAAYTTGTTVGIGASVEAEASSLWAVGDIPTKLLFRTCADGSAALSTRMTIDEAGNVLVGGSTAATSSVGNFHLFNGTAPTAGPTNGVVLYSEDVTSSAELKVMDEADNITTLSPHNFSLIPEGPSEDMAWAFYSERNGKAVNVDMLKLARMVEKLTGEKLVYEA